MSTNLVEGISSLMKNSIAPINLLCLSKNAIFKIFTLLEDKDFLRLREISHAVKDMVDVSILNVRKMNADFVFVYYNDIWGDNVEIWLTSYFEEFLGNRNHGFLKIALIHVITELPFLKFMIDSDENTALHLKPKDLDTFLSHLKPRIAGIQWRVVSCSGATPNMIRSFAHFFKGKNAYEIQTGEMEVENSDFTPWLELLFSIKPMEADCQLPKFTKESMPFLLELANIVDIAKISSQDHASDIEFVSITKAMLRRKCSILQFSAPFQNLSLSELERILKFLHQSNNGKIVAAYTRAGPLEVQVGEYLIETRDIPEIGRSVAIYPIGKECPDNF